MGEITVGDAWSASGYDFENSLAIADQVFVGLAIDEENQADLTPQRVEEWIDTIRKYFG